MNTISIPVAKPLLPRWWRGLSWHRLKGATLTTSPEALIVLASVFFALASNGLFWRKAMATDPGDIVFAASLLLILTGVHALLFGLLVWRWNGKVLLSLILIATAFATHYMNSFNVYIDADMVRNVLATDAKEAGELMTLAVLWPLLVHALLPIMVLWRVRFRPRHLRRAFWSRSGLLLGAALSISVGLMFSFQEMSALLRNHREVRYLATPVNYLIALKQTLAVANPIVAYQPKQPIGTDAKALAPFAASQRKPRLLLVVVGETARARNWGLNGYARQTTPQLAKMPDVINFPDMHACGSSTEVSVPCMFSPQGRRNYNERQIRRQESLLHVLEYAGISTLWRDNQSGCKGVCDGLAVEAFNNANILELCHDGRCLDEVLLHQLADKAREVPGDRVIILHQLGNHGPAYYLRHPPELRQFTPTCDTPDLGKCSRDAIVNSYDNALLYTDHLLAQAITTLRGLDDYDTALMYMSDHGESLGEKGLYLHGMPYAIAPSEQLRVPMVMWFSAQFAHSRGLDMACINQRAQQPANHDHLFSSVLGLMQVQTAVYDPSHDLFSRCAG